MSSWLDRLHRSDLSSDVRRASIVAYNALSIPRFSCLGPFGYGVNLAGQLNLSSFSLISVFCFKTGCIFGDNQLVRRSELSLRSDSLTLILQSGID